MATQAQIIANQKNAALSTGPVTAQGKQTASRNAAGPVAGAFCISTENQDEFNDLKKGWFDCFQPVGEVEINLVDEIIMSRWRQQRLWIMETVVLNRAIKKIKEEDPDAATYSNDVLQGLAAINLTENSKTWATLQRYERNYRRSYERAVAELRQIQAERKQAAAEPTQDLFKALLRNCTENEANLDEAEQNQQLAANHAITGNVRLAIPGNTSGCDPRVASL